MRFECLTTCWPPRQLTRLHNKKLYDNHVRLPFREDPSQFTVTPRTGPICQFTLANSLGQFARRGDQLVTGTLDAVGLQCVILMCQ